MSDPLPVTVVDTDWWSIAASLTGVVALILAVVALIRTEQNRIAAEKANADERRTVFELEVLRDLMPLVANGNYNAGSAPLVRGLVAALPPGDLPLLRLCIRTEDEGGDYSLPGGPVFQALLEELRRRDPNLSWSDEANATRLAALALTKEIRESMERRVR